MPNPAPVAPSERIEAIDVVRGFAVLGILLMNILAFGLPFQAYSDPSADGATQGIDFAAFVGVEVFAEGVFRALFSMLFGAGVAILATGERAKSAGVYYRRQFLLLGFGLLDTFVLLWTGDILVLYALVGLVLYPMRNWRPKALFVASGIVFAYLACFYLLMFWLLAWLPEQADALQARIAAGEQLSASEQALLDEWAELKANFVPTPEALENERTKFGDDYLAAFKANAVDVGVLYAAYPLFLFWDAFACMVLGMALYKTGVLRGARGAAFYGRLAVGGLAVGLAVNAFEVATKAGSGFALHWVSSASSFTNDVGRVALALGYVGIVALVCQRGALASVRGALAAVGRMALSNYILQSVFGLLLFHGFAFGLWNELPRHQLYLVVLAQWVVMIAFSVLWLRRYRFGPLEWLWRSLTYGRLASMKS